MFDIAFSELLIIGVVALIVIGPERLPKVARTAGQWLGKLNRYVSQVKQDIDRDIKLDELRKVQQEMSDTAQKYEIMAKDTARQVEAEVEEEVSQVNKVVQAMSATDGGLTQQEFDKLKAVEAAAEPGNEATPMLPAQTEPVPESNNPGKPPRGPDSPSDAAS